MTDAPRSQNQPEEAAAAAASVDAVAAATEGPEGLSSAAQDDELDDLSLEAVEDIDFLLEEIEDKIAPLALA